MSHHDNDHTPLILFLLFPGAFVAYGTVLIGWWIIKGVFFVIVAFLFLIYSAFAPAAKIETKPVETSSYVAPQSIQTTSAPIINKQPQVIKYMQTDEEENVNEDEDEEVSEIMQNQGLDREEATHVKEIMDDEGLDEDEAMELKDDL